MTIYGITITFTHLDSLSGVGLLYSAMSAFSLEFTLVAIWFLILAILLRRKAHFSLVVAILSLHFPLPSVCLRLHSQTKLAL